MSAPAPQTTTTTTTTPSPSPPQSPTTPNNLLPTPRISTRGLPDPLRLTITRLLLAHYTPTAIATQERINVRSVYRVLHNLKTYGSARAPLLKKLGKPVAIEDEDALALERRLREGGWMSQKEVVRWLEGERGVVVSQSTVSRFFKGRGWSRRVFARKGREKGREGRAVGAGDGGVA